ncbi:MAG: PorT family protein [Bacteroidales bacterium]|nr:PorT family protein [Bacteroidales bacterium]
MAILTFAAGEASAQWAVGLRGGCNSTTISRSSASRIDETYSAHSGMELGVQGRYTISPWLAVRANISYMQRNHRMDRNLNYLDPVYTIHRNNYLMLPVEADFSFGGKRLHGHLLVGGYCGYWLSEIRRGTTYWMTDYHVYFDDFDEKREFNESDQRFCAGPAIGAAISYSFNPHWEMAFDAIYYYDLTSHHHGYEHLADPRYLNTISLNLNILYCF